jgi:ABC-type Fe3+ transport system substrate-binding protein
VVAVSLKKKTIATINSSKHKSEAQAFMNYVLSPAGQQVLTAAGFEKP